MTSADERWAEHKRLAERSSIPDRDGYESAAQYAKERRTASCDHEKTSNQGVCLDCETFVENWEPSDSHLRGVYDIDPGYEMIPQPT